MLTVWGEGYDEVTTKKVRKEENKMMLEYKGT
jgi:hypothetical protein